MSARHPSDEALQTALQKAPQKADPAVELAVSLGRSIQSDIYRPGISGQRPVVPVDHTALEAAAEALMSPEAFAYIAGGAGAERTMAANRAAFDRWQTWPRPLRNVSQRDLSIDLFGRRATPLLLAPIGVAEMAHPDADLAVARAAASVGLPVPLSNQASFPREEVAAAAPTGTRHVQK